MATSQSRLHDTGAVQATIHWSLLVLTIFQALSAIAGGIAILATNGLGMPASMLANGPFDSFLWPGIILLIIMGGTQTIAATLLRLHRQSALVWCTIAGFGMIIWIFVETGIIGGTSWLQVLYFGTGALQLMLVLALLGIFDWLSAKSNADSHRYPVKRS